MPIAIGSYLNSLLSPSQDPNSATPSRPSLAQTLNEDERASSRNALSTTVTLSDAAKAYVARTEAAADVPLALIAADARTWFDQQYRDFKISSAMLDGQVAVDLTGQTRAMLSAVASNAQGFFTTDERTAAGIALQSRFDDAMAPHAVIARHSSDYASLYQAASDYLDQAGADERATEIWQDQKQAVVRGLVAAKATPGEAPDTGDRNDPVRALLNAASADESSDPDASTDSVAAKARALVDDQIEAARDDGADLSFRPSRRAGPQVDFSDFDNRMLAVIVLDPKAEFSGAEVRAAKAELDQRTRLSLLSAVTSGADSAGGNLNLLQTYARMSDEEKSVLGVTDEVTSQLVQNYRKIISIQNAMGGGANAGTGAVPSISAYL